MAALTTAGSTVFKFIRSEKTWRETGSGNVTFSLQSDRLMVSVGDMVYVVQGGVKRKGSKAVVMRVKKDSSKSKKVKPESMIIAVRFERLKDTQHVLSLLKLAPWIRSRPRKKLPRGPPPTFYLSMSTRERENVKALISKAKARYIVDGTIQRQLISIYKMTQEQIDEAIDYFHPRLSSAEIRRQSHYREPSFSRTDNSSLPSVGCGVPLAPKGSPVRRIGSLRPFPSNKSGQLLGVGATNQATHSKPGSTIVQSEVATAGVAIPNVSGRVHSRPWGERSPLKLATKKNEKHRRDTLENPTFDDFVGKAPEIDNIKPTLEDAQEDEVKNLDAALNLETNVDGEKTPSPKKENRPTTHSPKQTSVPKAISRLTADNLILHNKLLKPSKGDFKLTVTMWLKASLPE
jgi:hypothetical protein